MRDDLQLVGTRVSMELVVLHILVLNSAAFDAILAQGYLGTISLCHNCLPVDLGVCAEGLCLRLSRVP